jgi:hypothetical protein
MTTLTVERLLPGWGLWLQWTRVTVLGLVLGLAVGGPIIAFGAAFADLAGYEFGGVIGAVAGCVGGTLLGMVAGVTQRRLVRRYVVGPWVRASMTGYALSFAVLTSLFGLSSSGLVGLCFPNPDTGNAGNCPAIPPVLIDLNVIPGLVIWSLGGIAIGTVVGSMQWLVLRRHVPRAGWWVLAGAAGSVAGTLLIYALNGTVPSLLNPFGVDLERYFLITIVYGTIGGITYAIITGSALVWLLRQTRSGIQAGTIEAHALKETS